MKKIIVFVVVYFIFFEIIIAQTAIYYPNIIWQKGYGGYEGEGNGTGWNNLLNVGNDIYLAGSTGSDSSGNITTHFCTDAFTGIYPNNLLLKLDTMGALVSQTRIATGKLPQWYIPSESYVYNSMGALNNDRLVFLTEKQKKR